MADGVLCDSGCRVLGWPDIYAAGDVARWAHPRHGQQTPDRALDERGARLGVLYGDDQERLAGAVTADWPRPGESVGP